MSRKEGKVTTKRVLYQGKTQKAALGYQAD